MTDTFELPVEPFSLARGGHQGPGRAMCFTELASVLAGEPFSSSPRCMSPIVRRVGMTLNDRLDDERRQRLLPFELRALGTAGDGRDEERQRMCQEWLLHHALPLLLDKAGRAEAARQLRELPPDLAVESVQRAIRFARDEAFAARTEARSALRDRILEEMRKRPAAAAAVADAAAAAVADAAAAAAAVAAAAADAVAVAVADAVAVAVAAAVADAAAAAAAVADAVAVAVAVAAADAVAAAVAAADADAAAKGRRLTYSEVYAAVRRAVYARLREKAEELARPMADELFEGALDLMDRMLPPEPLMEPAIDGAEIICRVAAAA